MYLPLAKGSRRLNRGKSNRNKAKTKAHQRRRVNGMQGRKLSRRRKYNG